MPYLVRNDVNIYYEIYGEGSPLVLLGGLCTDHLIWLPVIPFLQAHFKIILIDNRGAGLTQATTTPFGTDTMADDVCHVLDQLNIASAHVVGNSMGGAIAQHLAIKHPHKVNKLILDSTFARTVPLTMLRLQTSYQMLAAGLSRELWIKNNISTLFSNEFVANPDNVEAVINFDANHPYPQSTENFALQVNACLQHNTLGLLAEIKQPTLVISGENDMVAPPYHSVELAQAIPNAKLQSINNMGHLYFVEQPERYAEWLTQFLKYATT